MKPDQKSKLHQSNLAELLQQLSQLQQELATTRQLIKLGKEKNTKKTSAIRHQIAVIKTIVTQKELEAKSK